MSLPFRITHQNNDYLYQVLNAALIKNKPCSELEILFDQQKIHLVKDEKERWVQKEGEVKVDPDLVQAIGRTVSLRFRT